MSSFCLLNCELFRDNLEIPPHDYRRPSFDQPESMIGDDYLFLDDLTIKDVERELGVEVIPSGYDAGDFVRQMLSR